MKIRSVLSAAVLAVATTLAASQALAQEKFTLRLAETWGPNFPIFGDASRNMAAMAEKMSNGRLKIRIDSANKHKAPLGVFDMVKAGQYDMGHSASYYWKGKVPNTLFFTSMPFGMTAQEQYAWFYHGDGMELMQEVYAPHNLLSFPGGNTGIQMGGWFRKEIKSLDDLKGLKMRIPGFAGEVFAEVGVNPTNIAPGELYTALERNTIDAVEWVGPALDLRLGFQQIADYYYTGWHEPATELQFLVNKKVWEKLPEDTPTSRSRTSPRMSSRPCTKPTRSCLKKLLLAMNWRPGLLNPRKNTWRKAAPIPIFPSAPISTPWQKSSNISAVLEPGSLSEDPGFLVSGT